MKAYKVSVCKGPDCRRGGSDSVHQAFAEALAKAGLSARCQLARGGCYGLCHLGPNVIVREQTGQKRDPFSREDFQLMGLPGETHYGQMAPDKVEPIICEHLEGDQPVEVLRSLGEPEKK